MALTRELQEVFNGITANRLLRTTMMLRKSKKFSIESLRELHDTTFVPVNVSNKAVANELRLYMQLRPESDRWTKTRNNVIPFEYIVYYSKREDADFTRAENAIKAALPENMVNLSYDEKLQRLAHAHTSLDFLHMFGDGNSRCNRVFIRELAYANNINLDYTKVNQKEMYAARDRDNLLLSLEVRGKEFDNTFLFNKTIADEIRFALQDLDQHYPNLSTYSLFKRIGTEMENEVYYQQEPMVAFA